MNGTSLAGRYIRDVTIANNVVEGSLTYGLTADYCQGITYSGNYVTGCSGFGIWLWKQVEVSVVGNHLTGNNTGNSATMGDLGIGGNAQTTVGETSDVTVTGNIIGKVYVYSGTRIIIRLNHILTSYTVSTNAPVATVINRSDSTTSSA